MEERGLPPNLNTRYMIRKDLEQALAIEEKSYSDPWQESDFVSALRQRNIVGVVVEDDKYNIYGYMFYELRQNEYFISNITVHPDYTRLGIGTYLLNKLKTKLYAGFSNRRVISINVVDTNLKAQLFLKSKGFIATRILKDYYDTVDNDAYHMEYIIHEESNIDYQEI